MAAISPEKKDDNPYNLPSGNSLMKNLYYYYNLYEIGEELMNRTIQDPGLSGIIHFLICMSYILISFLVKEKELLFVTQNVAERLGQLVDNGKFYVNTIIYSSNL